MTLSGRRNVGRRRISLAGAIILAAAVLWLGAGPVHAIPPMPCTFWGTVTIDGEEAPAGTGVSVWSGGTKWAERVVMAVDTETGTQLLYSVDVPGDDPETEPVDGPPAGGSLQFRVHTARGVVIAPQVGVWQEGTATRLDLTVALPSQIHLPLLMRP